MKRMRLDICLICLLVLICFSGCVASETGTNSKENTYEDLDETEKRIVNGMYDSYEYWKSCRDSGTTTNIPTTIISTSLYHTK